MSSEPRAVLCSLSSPRATSTVLDVPQRAILKMMGSRPQLYDFHGVAMTHCVTDNWEKVKNFQARPDDILIATYPKAGQWNSVCNQVLQFVEHRCQELFYCPLFCLLCIGTTWVSYILDLLYFRHLSPERQTSIPVFERVPFLEIAVSSVVPGTELADQLPTSPRLIKTHLPIQLVPQSFWDQNCRMVYVARNAKDNMVSFYHFDRMNQVQPEPGEWSNYFQRFLDGQSFLLFLCCPVASVLYGSWYEHVGNWWNKTKTYPKLHYMFYEDIAEFYLQSRHLTLCFQDTEREIDKLCSFLGSSPSAEDKKTIVELVHFDNMKNNEMTNCSKRPFFDFSISPFMRKGKVGDWKTHFTVAQNEAFDEDYRSKMKDPTLRFRTEI
ncbi:hypothetical protein CCH79_00015914 [Gambusia affinis]|uniref:Sulfotransferase n=1 Tax=Gambusia affinis TaxID=33528 RepID=A0A315VYA1_GAMAF|nr:hypothetical protein CCH79_00015914 [Gambusia affinis]